MHSLKEIKIITSNIFNSSIGAITKILFSLPLIPQLCTFCTPFVDLLIRYLYTPSLHLPILSIVININVATNFSKFLLKFLRFNYQLFWEQQDQNAYINFPQVLTETELLPYIIGNGYKHLHLDIPPHLTSNILNRSIAILTL